jgi:hypothetical protein
MSAKPRSDSLLKNLPEERQDQIAAWCREPKSDSCPGGLQHAREQCAADGLKVSMRAMSEFFSWWRVGETCRQASNKAQDFESLLKAEFPGATPEKIASMGQMYFTLQASNSGDADTFINLESLRLAKSSAETKARQKEEDLRLSAERVKLMASKLQFEIGKHLDLTAEKLLSVAARAKAEEINASNVSQAEKIAAMRKFAFADVDAYLAQGKLDLPE